MAANAPPSCLTPPLAAGVCVEAELLHAFPVDDVVERREDFSCFRIAVVEKELPRRLLGVPVDHRALLRIPAARFFDLRLGVVLLRHRAGRCPQHPLAAACGPETSSAAPRGAGRRRCTANFRRVRCSRRSDAQAPTSAAALRSRTVTARSRPTTGDHPQQRHKGADDSRFHIGEDLVAATYVTSGSLSADASAKAASRPRSVGKLHARRLRRVRGPESATGGSRAELRLSQ